MTEPAIALVGLRCSGKTSVARELASRLGRRLVDLDDEVAREAGCGSAGEVLETLGLARFRELERSALARALAAGDAPVVATGGGVVEDSGNRALLSQRARAVWLRAGPGVLRARMELDPTLRPALAGGDPLEEIETLAARREPLYRAVARIELETDHLDVPGAAREIARRL